jgi:hypothetical protein
MGRAAESKNARRRRAGSRDPQRTSAEPRAIPQDADVRERQERLLDEGIEETFPASDPVAVMRLT